MSYYNLEQTLEILQKNLPETLLPFDLPQLADLCRREELTPVFSYAKYVSEGFLDEYGQLLSVKKDTKPFNGYLTLPSLIDLLFQLTETIVTANAYIYEEIGTQDKGALVTLEKGGYDPRDSYYTEHDYYDTLSSGDFHYITINNLLFPIEQVKAYISSKLNDELDKPAIPTTIGNFGNPTIVQGESNTDTERIIELEKELAAVKAELKEQTDTLADDSVLQTILDEKNEYHAPDLKYAIQLWIHLYIDGKICNDSHSNKANLWINSNTSYGDIPTSSSVKRLREVSTPLKDFGGQRKRESEK